MPTTSDSFATASVQPTGGEPEASRPPGVGAAYLVFYVEREDEVDVWRILHSARDIPRWLSEPLDD